MDWFLNYRQDLRDTSPTASFARAPATGCWRLPTKERLDARCAICWTKTNFSPLSDFAPSRATIAIIPTSFTPATKNIGSITFRAKERVISLAAIRTGADRSGSRSIILIVEALERYHHFYGDDFQVECPTGSGNMMNLKEVAQELAVGSRHLPA